MKPMLAADCEGKIEELKYPVMVSPKIDGIRCMVVEGWAVTRSLKPQPNRVLHAALSKIDYNGLDGELVVPGETFQETTSRVMGRSNQPENVEWHVFDDFTDPGLPFADRILKAKQRVTALANGSAIPIKYVQHYAMINAYDLAQYEEGVLLEGYEGAMIRDPNGKYKFGRSTVKEGGLLKLKRFTDAEAVIVGFEEKMHNGNEATKNELGRTARSSSKAGKTGVDTLGAFVLERADGVRFNCGTGLNDEQRDKYWAQRDNLLGGLVKYKFQEHGTKDAPRSPVFLGIRDRADV